MKPGITAALPFALVIQLRPRLMMLVLSSLRNAIVVVRPLEVNVVELPLSTNAVHKLESAATVRRGRVIVNVLIGAMLVAPAVKLVAL